MPARAAMGAKRIVLRLSDALRSYDRPTSSVRFGVLIGLWVAMLSAVVNIRSISNDNIPNALLPVSLLRQGNVELSEFLPAPEDTRLTRNYWAVRTDRGVYSRYPIWTGVAAAPIFAPFVAFGADRAAPRSGQAAGHDEAALLRLGRLAALVFTALFAGVLAITFRRFMPGRWAALLVLLTVLGTTLLHAATSQLSNQTLPVLCVALLLAIVSTPKTTRRRALAAGILAGLAIASRLPAIFPAVMPLGVFVTRRTWRRHLGFVLAGGLVFPLLTLAYNARAFGGPFDTGYGAEGRNRFEAPLAEGLAGLMLSPTCGLLVYSPFLALGGAAAIGFARRRIAGNGRGELENDGGESTRRPAEAADLGRWIALGFVGQWLLMSKWWAWNGALVYGGPRMLAEGVPGLTLLIALNWRVFSRAGLGGSWARRWLLWSGVWSLGLYLVGSVVYDAVAPGNPPKLNWDIRQDFIALYIERFGVSSLLIATLKHGAMLLGTILLGGHLVGRVLSTTDRAAGRGRETRPGRAGDAPFPRDA